MNLFILLKKRLEIVNNRKLSPEAIRRIQLKKFRKLVSTIILKSSYYRNVITKKGIDPTHCSPDDFPVLTKRDVIENFDKIVTDPEITKDKVSKFLDSSKSAFDLFRNRYYVINGSGTSGETCFFVYSKKDFFRGMAQSMDLIPLRLQRKRTRVAFAGITQGHHAAITMMTPSMSQMAKLSVNTKLFEITLPVDRIVDEMNAFQPDILLAYANVLKLLAQKQMEGTLDVRPSLIGSFSEPLSSDKKEIIEAAFKCKLSNIYASTEFLNMGISKPEYGGMYLLENDLIFDIRKDHVLVTSLFNHTMPLIRYRMDDILAPVADEDKILPFTKVKEVIGRGENTMILTNRHGADDFITPDEICHSFIGDLWQYQVRLIDKQNFIYRAVFQKNLGELRKNEVLEKLKSKIASFLLSKQMDNVSFDVEEVESLPIDPKTGKFRVIAKDAVMNPEVGNNEN